MAARKDSRGYALYKGECQRKGDGRYSYSYTDFKGERHVVYAKTLADLRKKEKVIKRELEDGINPDEAERLTLNDVYFRFMAQKYNLKESTYVNYKYSYERFVMDTFGKKKICKIKYTDIKCFYHYLLSEKGIAANTLETINNVIHPALDMAVRDGALRTNPSKGVMGEIKKSNIWVKPKRHALTIPQQKAFLDYTKKAPDCRGWLPMMTVFLGTGMRMGELLGLRWEDLDFEKRAISVNHSMSTRPDRYGKCAPKISTPKTEAGTRTIPMVDEVYDAFLEEYEISRCIGFSNYSVDGYSHFVFVAGSGGVYTPTAVNSAIKRIIKGYNEEETKLALKEKREPVLLPDFSAHHLRHTFCTRLCENESNLKVIQSIMGHADISTTMDIYAECTEEKKMEVLGNINGKIFT